MFHFPTDAAQFLSKLNPLSFENPEINKPRSILMNEVFQCCDIYNVPGNTCATNLFQLFCRYLFVNPSNSMSGVIEFTLANATRLYSTAGNPMEMKGLGNKKEEYNCVC